MRRVLPLLVLLVVCVTSLGAQEMEDVLYLKDGSVVRGMIIEQVPNQSVRIRTRDGSVYVYTFNLIDRIAREPAQQAAAPQQQPQQQQQPQLKNARRGFWIGLGLGYGSLGFEDFDAREGGLSGQFKLGGTLSQNLLLGIQSTGWTKSFDEIDGSITFGVLAAIVQFYPMRDAGLYVSGGAGIGTLYASAFGESDSESGFGFVFGVGYDLRLGGMFSITPFANYMSASINSVNVNAYQFGGAVNWH